MSFVGIVKKLLEFVYAMLPYHEDVLNVSVINSRLTVEEDKNEFSTDSMKMFAYAGAIFLPIAVPLVYK